MTQPLPRSTSSSGHPGGALHRNTLVTLVAHSVIPVALLWLLGYGESGFGRSLIQLEYGLPAAVEASLKLPGLIHGVGLFLFGPAVAAALIVDVGIYRWLRRKVGESTGLAWSYLILIVEGAFVGWMGVCYVWGLYSFLYYVG